MSSPIPILPTTTYSGREDDVGPKTGSAGLYPTRLSPTLTRNLDPHDPSNLERQRTMDADVAIQLSRARSARLAAARRPSNAGPPASSYVAGAVSVLPTEEEDRVEAYNIHMEDHGHDNDARMRLIEPENRAHDPALLVASPEPSGGATPHVLSRTHHTETMYAPPPEYLPPAAYRTVFDFGPLEEFGRAEKKCLQIVSPVDTKPQSPKQDLRRRLGQDVQQVEGAPALVGGLPHLGGTPGEASMSGRSRQQKLSSSHPQPRRGKPAASPTLHSQIPLTSSFEDGQPTHMRQQRPHITRMQPDDICQDKPFRFSFYSNALPSTIHARSLAELPAEGQTFEELFWGEREQQQRGSHVPLGHLGSLATMATTAVNVNMGSGYVTPAARSDHRFGGNHTMESTPPPGPSSRGPAPYDDGDADTWFLDVLSPTNEEMCVLSKVFGIHPLTTEDILMEETREKVELFQNYYLVSFRSFDQNPYSPTYLEPINFYIIVFREGTLSFHFRAAPHLQNVRRRIKQLKDYISVTSDWISYALIDDITDAFEPLIQGIEYEVDSIDELVLILRDSERTEMMLRIGRCRKKVMGFLRLMGNKADVVKGLAKRYNENWSITRKSDIGLYLSDIQDHLITMTQSLNHYEMLLSRLHSNYLAQISIDMTDANNQINNVLSRMTALGTVLLPVNVITGLWGMNVHVPGQDDRVTYSWLVGIVCVLVSFGLLGGFVAYRAMRKPRTT